MATKKQAETQAETTKARVLLDCIYGLVDEVIELTPDQVKEAVESGRVDPDPVAVAYAEALAK